MRLARLYSFGILLSFGLLALLATDIESFTRLTITALKSASLVVAGLSAWASAGDLANQDKHNGLATLVGVHGVGAQHLEQARTFGAAFRTITSIALPALGIIALGAIKLGSIAWAAALGVGALVYAAGLGSLLVLVARLCALLARARGKLLLLLVLLLPELGHALAPAAPSLSSVCSVALTRLQHLGERFT